MSRQQDIALAQTFTPQVADLSYFCLCRHSNSFDFGFCICNSSLIWVDLKHNLTTLPHQLKLYLSDLLTQLHYIVINPLSDTQTELDTF